MTDAGVAPTTSMDTGEALARLARARDPEAWSALIDRHGAAILRSAARITHDAALQEDICQETLLQIRAHAGAFTPQGRGDAAELLARGWIMRIACCTALKMIRARSRAVEREQQSTLPASVVATPPERAAAREEAETVRREVAALPEAHRDAVSLRFFGELAYAEIGAILKISEEAAKKRVQRGLDLLRARLAAGGVALSAVLLMNVLQQGAAQGGEAAGPSVLSQAGQGADAFQAAPQTLDISRRAAWQALVNSSQTPALSGVVLGGGLTMGMKTGLGIAAAAMLALGIGGTLQLNATRQMASDAAAAAADARAQSRALETKLEGSRNEIDALRRLVEARNSELTSLRDKVAELDKRKASPTLTADRIITRHIGDAKGQPQTLQFFADAAAVDDKGNVQRQFQFPGGQVIIQGNAGEPFEIALPQGEQGEAARKQIEATQKRLQEMVKTHEANRTAPGGVRLAVPPPPAVVPPKPPEKADGNF